MTRLKRALSFGMRMTEAEYRANLSGLNIFFGAVLGFVLAGTEQLDDWRFAFVLLLVAGIVITILYISSSRHRLVYLLLAAFGIGFFPHWLGEILPPGAMIPPKLQPTLAVWAALTAFVEFAPREQSTAATTTLDD